MSNISHITLKKQALINLLIDELHDNLSLIDELEEINNQKIYRIEKLRSEIILTNPNFKDSFQIALKDNFIKAT